MHSILLKFINPLTGTEMAIPSYGLIVVVAFLTSGCYLTVAGRHKGIDRFSAWLIVTQLLAVGLLGSGLWDLILTFLLNIGNAGLRSIGGQPGLAWYGGLASATFFGYWLIKRLGFVPMTVFDLLAPMLLVGYAIGRMGCLLAGCCYGSATDLPWAITYPPAIMDHTAPSGIPLHPTPIYAALIAVISLIILFFIRKYFPRSGQLFVVTIGFHSIGRFVEEFYRGDHEAFLFSLTMTQLWALLIFLAVLVLLMFNRRFQIRSSLRREPVIQ